MNIPYHLTIKSRLIFLVGFALVSTVIIGRLASPPCTVPKGIFIRKINGI